MKDLIYLQNIVKEYGDVTVLDDVSVDLQPGVTGLLGPNGAGKSTLIKVILGLVRISSGSGMVMGMDLLKSGKEIRSKIGYMPEDDSYIAGMSGIEVVRYSACLSGMQSMEGLRRAHEILDYCDVHQEPVGNQDPRRLKTLRSYSAPPPIRRRVRQCRSLHRK